MNYSFGISKIEIMPPKPKETTAIKDKVIYVEKNEK
jgi:hypothetical protein